MVKSRRRGVLGRGTEGVVGLQYLLVLRVGGPAEGAHLYHLAAPEKNLHQAEAPADYAAVFEKAADLLGVRVGAHVEVLGFFTQEQITHASAHQIGQKAMIVQSIQHLACFGVHVSAAYVVLGTGNDAGRWRLPVFRGLGAGFMHGCLQRDQEAFR